MYTHPAAAGTLQLMSIYKTGFNLLKLAFYAILQSVFKALSVGGEAGLLSHETAGLSCISDPTDTQAIAPPTASHCSLHPMSRV